MKISDDIMEDSSEGNETTEDSIEVMQKEEIRLDLMMDYVETRHRLHESGVIGRVLNDFMPCMLFHVVYNDNLVALGDQLWLSQVQTEPDINLFADDAVPQFSEARCNGRYVIVMTDADAPCGEYLHGIFNSSVGDSEGHEIDAPWQDLFAHEPPRTEGRMIVFTIFTARPSQHIAVPNMRQNFSTRDFADRNALGLPLAAAFLYIKSGNKNADGNERESQGEGNAKELIAHSLL